MRRQLQPDLRLVGELDRLESLLPGGFRLAAQIEPPRRGVGPRPDLGQLRADTRLGIFRECDITAEDVEIRRLAPAKSVAEIEV